MSERVDALARLLSGGDLRSTGAADRAARELVTRKWELDDFLLLLEGASPVVRMRAADALEKASRSSPELLSNAGSRLLPLLLAEQPKEVRWHLLQMAPRPQWAGNQRKALLKALEAAFADKSAIVQASALQALWELSAQSDAFEAAFQQRLMNAKRSKRPSLRARARKLAKHVSSAPDTWRT